MKKLFFIFIIMFLFVACSNTNDNENSDHAENTNDSATAEMGVQKESSMTETNDTEENSSSEDPSSSSKEENLPDVENRKIIYNANMQLETNHFQDTTNFLEEKAKSFQGYIVSSNQSTHGENERKTGSMTMRIPSEHFQKFISLIEDGDMKILNKSITGEDVTEQYVDLKSRLKAKKVVEERLLSFMEKAEKTEDLLKISSDLAEVQETIEQITGKMNYLENQSDFATVTVDITERNVEVPNVQDESLNTWDKTKDQFLTSLQFILTVISGLFVFLIGNTPILILLAIVAFFIFLIIRKSKHKEK